MVGSPPGRLSGWYAVALLVAVFLVAGFLRLNDLSLYSPDSIRYVIWGNSLVHGGGFTDDTQPDPQRFVEHAPLYSVLIAPVELFFPRSLMAVKVATLCWGGLALALAYLWLRRRVGGTAALAGTILVVCNPLLLVYSTEALTEAPFVAFLCGLLLLAERVAEDGHSSRTQWYLLVAVVGTIGLLREVGAAASIAAALFFLLHRHSRRAAMLLGAAALCLGAWYVRNQVLVGVPDGSADANSALVFQHFVTAADASLAAEFAQRIWLNLLAYSWQLGGMLLYPLHGSGQVNLALTASDLPHVIRLVIVDLSVPLVGAGIVADAREPKGAIFRGVLVLGYLLIVLVYPVHDIRFLFPLLPLLVYYLLKGVAYAAAFVPAVEKFGRPRVIVPALLVVMLPNLVVSADILSTNASYRRSPMGFYRELIALPSYPTIYTFPWSLAGGWIRDSVPDGAVIASPAKQLAITVGERKVLEANPGLTLPLFEKMLRDNGVTYLLSENRWEDFKLYEFLMAESERYRFDSVFGAANLRLYKVTSRLRAPGARAGAPAGRVDSASASGLLRIGREAFLRGEYQAAVQCYLLGAQRAPGQPEPLYEAVAASTMEGDSVQAQRLYERLMTYPQAASLTYLARTHIEAMRVALSANGVPPTQERAIKMNDLARLYWDMGYREKAETLADASLRYDSTYFWGLLWGFHFNQQNGDTAGARHYYAQLAAMDPDNQVVVSFRRLLAIEDSLRVARDPAARSALHVSAGRLYQLIELFEEALDEGERALGDDPDNIAATQLLGEVFLTKGRALRGEDARGTQGNGPLRQAARLFTQVLEREPANAYIRAKSDSLRATLPIR